MKNGVVYMIYNSNEKAQIFIDLSEKNISYEGFLKDITSLGIYSIQVNVNQYSIGMENKLKELLTLSCKSIILNINCKEEKKFEKIGYNFTSITVDYSYEDLCECTQSEIFFNGKNYGVRINYDQDYDLNILKSFIQKFKNIRYIILNPHFISNDKISMKLYKKEEKNTKKLLHVSNVLTILDNGFYEKEYILKHPCNIYLCSGKNCHTGKGQTLRRIHICENGDIYPEELVTKKTFCLGHIKDGKLNDILNAEKNNKHYVAFIELCRKVYLFSILNTSSNIIPFKYLINDISEMN